MPHQPLHPPPSFIEWRKKNPNETQAVAAPIFGVNKSTISRWDAWIRINNTETEAWDPPPRNYPDSFWDLTEADVPALLKDFLAFRRRHFKTPNGKVFLTPEFQVRWILAFLYAVTTGGRLVILSPPRHGKTELLIHFCTWLIVRFSMIRILWIGGNEKIARRSVSQVASHLTTNEPLIIETLPPAHSYRPDRKDGLSWSKNEFTVSTRPFPVKGASMTGLGRGGTLLSLDADLIVADDIEDHSSTTQPGNREGTREWWTSDLESRKEEHTALAKIGSRQHPDDLDSHLIENEEYEVIVETAHDSACTIPDDADHYAKHTKCLLFPEIRSFRWLMKQRQAAETTGGRHTFEMVYLNISHPQGMVIFTPEVVNKGLDRGRSIGDIPAGTRLMAGLDPSGTGYQAAFLWALQLDADLGEDSIPFKLYMVDTENNVGGGLKEARRIMTEWREKYGLREWVVEETMWASGLSLDHELMDWASRVGISIEGHLTYTNKWDRFIGVSSFVSMYLAEPVEISLPYLDSPSMEKTDAYRHQLIHFSSAGDTKISPQKHRRGTKSDLVMASWFPMDKIRRARSVVIAEMGVEYTESFVSFPESEWDSPPWGEVEVTSPW